MNQKIIKYFKPLFFLFIMIFFISDKAKADSLRELIPSYGVIKPKFVSTQVSIGSGIVHKIRYKLGDKVRRGRILISIIERETIRNYRNTLKGTVAKIHVTPGAAISAGMPLVTIVNSNKKYMEIAFSPDESKKVRKGLSVLSQNKKSIIGTINRLSPIVDPDTGTVLSFVNLESHGTPYRIGEVLPIFIEGKVKNCQKVIPLKELGLYTTGYKVKFISGDKACLEEILL
ncbi:HlyD family efflux transporter periplasmic adaptor subunit [Bacteriovoracales bacterium]|nr:HlyD family efflux transporter periplasmic adaptor subunit [Bacteriovoracales bacterium]